MNTAVRFPSFPFVVCALMAGSCSKEKPELSDLEAAALTSRERFEQVDIRYSDSAALQVRIKAPEMIRHADPGDLKEEFAKGFFAMFYDKSGTLRNTLSSKYALRIHSEGKTFMKDSVRFSDADEAVLITAELVWDERNGTLYTDKFVRILRKDEVLQGYGFETDQNFRKGTIRSIDAIIPSEKLFREGQ